jgi:hypothetical protein
LRITAAKVVLGMASTEELIDAAHDALNDGVYSYSLGELATFRNPTWADCHPLFVAALRELQEPLPDPAAAITVFLELHAVRLAEGAAAPEEVLYDLYSLQAELRYDPPVKVPEESWAALQPFIDAYYALEEYYGIPQPEGTGPDELHAEAIAPATRWCRDHWRPIVNPAWLTSTVLALAKGIDAEKAFDRLPILADALQDSGCENTDVLEHCRGPGPHVHGCWVVDLLLGKE